MLEISRSGFYAWKKRPSSTRSNAKARLAVEIMAAHKKSGRRYGSPRVHRALRKNGIRASRKRVERVCAKNGIIGRQKRRFRRTTDSKHDSSIAPNVACRGDDPLRIMQRAGHSDFKTTQGYIRVAENLSAGFGSPFPDLPPELLKCQSAHQKA